MIHGYGGRSAILGIGTALPPYRIGQEDAARRIAAAGQAEAAKLARRLFRQCGVETRYTCEPSFALEAERCRYLSGEPGTVPSTKERGDTYRRHALPLALAAAEAALADAGVAASDITHLFAVSCTGLYLPGLDAELVRRLGLRPDAQRLPLSFVGCAAGLKAVGLAAGMTERERTAKALVVCVELCSLHVQPGAGRNGLLAAAMFGDGAAACVIGERAEEGTDEAGQAATRRNRRRGLFALGRYRSALLPGGAADMTWSIGDHGYELLLSPRIPELIARFVPEQLELLTAGLQPAKPGLWAIHPGGRAILDALRRLQGLSERQLEPSRTVLRNVGNVSSATILFVLEELRLSLEAGGVGSVRAGGDAEGQGGETADGCGAALAFGPGLTAELLTFAYVPPSGVAPIREEEIRCADTICASGTNGRS
jgi:predicted naringenin-chalcone synthase